MSRDNVDVSMDGLAGADAETETGAETEAEADTEAEAEAEADTEAEADSDAVQSVASHRATPARLAGALRPLAMPLAYTAFTLLVFWYLWTPIPGAARTWKYDPVHEYWGDLIFQLDTLLQGRLALWNPHDRGGFPVYGDPQPGLLYPANWLLWAWGALAGSMPHALMELKIVAHWIFGAIGMHLFLRRRRAAEPACFVGGTLFAFASPAIRYGGNALNWTYPWIPWVLLATDWFAERPDTRRAVVLGTTVAMTLLSGAPAMFLYMLVIALPYGVHVLWSRLRAQRWPLLRAVAVAAAVAVLWVLPLVVSNLAQVPHSVRDERDLAFITNSSFHPVHLLNLLVPNLGGENIYYGLLPLCCFALLLASRRPGRGIVFLAVGTAGVLLALGAQADFLASAASLLSPFSLFRQAHRYLYILTAAVAAGAGLGLGRVLAMGEPPEEHEGPEGHEAHEAHAEHDEHARARTATCATWVCGLVTVVLAIGWVVSVVVSERLTAPKNNALALAVLSAAAGTWIVRALLLTRGRRRRAHAWAAVVLVAISLWIANVDVQRPGLAAKPVPRQDAVVDGLEGVRDLQYRVYDHEFLHYRPGVRLGIRDFSGYEDDPLGLSRYRDFLAQVRRTPPVLGHANVRYYLVGKPRSRLRLQGAGVTRAVSKNVLELQHVAPAVMYVARPEIVPDIAQAMIALAGMTPGTGAVVEVPGGPGSPHSKDNQDSQTPGIIPQGPAHAPVTAGRLVRLEPNHVVAEIDAPGPGLVVIAEAYYPAWTATVDGQPVPILPANGMFRGIPIAAAGPHRIEMHLRPARFWATLPAYALAAALLLWAVIDVRGRRGRDQ